MAIFPNILTLSYVAFLSWNKLINQLVNETMYFLTSIGNVVIIIQHKDTILSIWEFPLNGEDNFDAEQIP